MRHTATSDLEEATYQSVLRPQIAARGKAFDAWITSSSARWQRVAVVQLTRYLCLETKYRQDLSEDAEAWAQDKAAVFAIAEDITGKDGHERQGLVGILAFRQDGKNPILYHCYLHPFFRRRGLMENAWRAVQLRFPAFEIEPPLSPAMKSFLAKVDRTHVLPST